MSRVYRVYDALGARELGELDLPLRLGGGTRADVVLPGLDPEPVVAYIARSEGHAYIQPGEGGVPLFLNHEALSESAWLKSGDVLEAGPARLRWKVRGDQVELRATLGEEDDEASPEVHPPSGPPPGLANAVPAPTGRRGGLHRGLLAGLALLLVAALYVVVATPVTVRIQPSPEDLSLQGMPPPLPLGDRYLALPGRYTLRATRAGYRPLELAVEVAMGEPRTLAARLEELPGRVAVRVQPAVAVRLLVDGAEARPGPDGRLALGGGTHRLRLESERYLPEERVVEVLGRGRSQDLSVTLRPAWAELSVESRPPGATVHIDGEVVGRTPLSAEVLHGERRIRLSLEGRKGVTLERSMVAGQALRLGPVTLPPADATLALTTHPAGASVRVDGAFRGTAPLTLTLSPDAEHRLRLTRLAHKGVERSLRLAPGESRELTLSLPPEHGIVFLTARPADASLRVDGRPAGKATQRLRLSTRPHTLEVHKPGYATRRVTVTPRAGVSQTLDVVLQTERQAKVAGLPETVTTAAGQVLRLVRPGGPFTTGASRREPGRRANETRRRVRLERLFYIGEREVTNGELRRFLASHDSGAADGADLNSERQPAVRISWEDAARYCNWLSRQDGLPPAYREADGHPVLIHPPTTGYRLPTEAEWAYVARFLGRERPLRYPWTGSYPPKARAGNFADARIQDTLAQVVPGYDDGYRGSAPVGSFRADANGLYDLGGNVAEWVNDYYTVYPAQPGAPVVDPTGPASGEHHVVRGSSWRQASISELRLSYRDYSRAPRPDLGFRVARYAE